MTLPRVCVADPLTISTDGLLRAAPYSTPRLVVDVRADSAADGMMLKEITLPGKLLIDQKCGWINKTPVDHGAIIRVTRRYKNIVTSNPNAIQFRDRWTWAIDAPIQAPVTSGLYNGQVGIANDLGTNTVAEPNPGITYYWWRTSMDEEWVGPIEPDSRLDVWYRCYVWTPPPWSENANKNSPVHWAEAGWARISLIVYPQG